MNEPPLVSVIVPSFNRADFLVPTIESILRQDYPRIECIVVDGGSTDETLGILRSYGGRIKWLSEPDAGPPDAINKGWRMCSGEILTWLNADDVWAPGAVSTAVAYFRDHPEVDVVYGDCGIIDKDGKPISRLRVRDWDLRLAVEHCDHIIHQAASFMRRQILQRVGWLYSNLCHDHELWLRIALAGGRFGRVPALLAYARDHAGNLGYVSDLVVPLKLRLTREFFARPELPQELLALRKRAVSNAYLRGVYYVAMDRLRFRQLSLRLLTLACHAIRADPSNLLRTCWHLLRVGAGLIRKAAPSYLPESLRRRIRPLKELLFGKPSYGDFS